MVDAIVDRYQNDTFIREAMWAKFRRRERDGADSLANRAVANQMHGTNDER